MILTTTVNGKHVEQHEVSPTEEWLWRTAIGIDLAKIAAGEDVRPVELEDTPDIAPRTPEQEAASEREALIRALHGVEAAAKKLPSSASSIAGFLFGNGVKGNDTPKGNPLANYYRQAALAALKGPSSPKFNPEDLFITVQGSGVYLETNRFLLSIDPPPSQAAFLEGHRLGRYRELWAY